MSDITRIEGLPNPLDQQKETRRIEWMPDYWDLHVKSQELDTYSFIGTYCGR
jgi:hypothetical protein